MATATSEPTKLATGTAGRPSAASDQPNVMASIAPSAAPAETPSVNGVASGLRSRPWKTTPAAASEPPTSAPASVRGSRATKKICASALSAKGIEGSSARRRLTCVEPTSGARITAARASAPKPRIAVAESAADRPRHGTRVRAAMRRSRRHDEVPGCRVPVHIGLDAVQLADAGWREDVVGRAGGEHASVLQQHQRIAEAGGEVEVVGRQHDRERHAFAADRAGATAISSW